MGTADSITGRARAGIALWIRSVLVVLSNPRLLAFPFLASSFALVVLGGALGPFILLEQDVGQEALGIWGPLLAVGLVLGATALVTTWCNAALVYATTARFAGESPGVIASFKAVFCRFWRILSWSILATLVGTPFRALELSSSTGKRFVSFLFASSWTITTFFLVHQILFEDLSFGEIVKRKGDQFRDIWGDSLAGGRWVDAFLVVPTMLACLAVVLVPVVVEPNPPDLGLLGLAAFGIVVFGIVWYGTIWSVIRSALYTYARTGEEPAGFTSIDFERLATDRKW